MFPKELCLIPISLTHGVCAQVWTVDSRGELANCGVTHRIVQKGSIPDSMDWSNPASYDFEVNILLDSEWTSFGWPVLRGFRPAKRPLRDCESAWRRFMYDFFGWRPEVGSFRLPEDVSRFVAGRIERQR